MSGKSLKAAFAKDGISIQDELWFYHEGNRALRQGNWKIVHASSSPRRGSQRSDDEELHWHLYDLSTDRGEQHDLCPSDASRSPD